MIKDRIKILKSYFAEFDIDGYIIPKNDEFFSEYSEKDRLKIISNFSGSAGYAIILKKIVTGVGKARERLFILFKNSDDDIQDSKDESDNNDDNQKWLEVNKKYADIWPNISEKKDPPEDHEEFKEEENKYEKYFKENLE